MTKRKHSGGKGQSAYKKIRSEIQDFVNLSKSSGNTHGHERESTHKPQQSRKEKRKEARKLKKARRLAYNQRKPIPTQADIEKQKQEVVMKEKQELEKKKKKNKKKENRRNKAAQKRKEEEEKQQELELMNKYDDKEIKDLEKKLYLNRRKKKTLPKSFIDDGLDYILDAVDTEKLQAMAMEEEDSDAEKQESSDFEDEGLDMEEESENVADEMAKESDDSLDEGDDESHDDDDDDDGDDDDNSESKKSEADKSGKSDAQREAWEVLADRIQDTVGKTKAKKAVSFSKDVIEKDDFEESQGGVKKKVGLLPGPRDDDFGEDSDEDNDDHDDSESDESEDSNENDDDFGEEKDNFDSDIDEFEGDNFEEGFDGEKSDDSAKLKLTQGSGLKEDIYGRLRDAEGNIVKDNTGQKPGMYIPPAKRAQMGGSADAKKKAQLEKLQRQLKGLVNRASESNMQPISTQIEQMYMTNSRADVNDCLVSVILEASVSPVLTPERLAMEFMMLVAILHGNVGSEVGAAFLQSLVKRFDRLCKTEEMEAGKSLDNVLVLLAHLYNFKVVHSALIFDVIQVLVDSFKEKDVEVILLLLRHVGFSLRKDDPARLKDMILKIQTKASTEEVKSSTDQARLRFMLDVILAIKNNNMRKIPNYDPEHLEHLRKLIRTFIRGGKFGDNQLHIGLQDLRNAEEKGKWWVVGSAWEGGEIQQPEKQTHAAASVIRGLEISIKLQELARKQRMNTDTRRNIFYIIMTSEDYIDAFEKLLRLGLKSSQQQEIIIVILDCCLQEKKFNPFYAYLGQKFCEHHRSYQMAFQFTIWDRFKEIGNLSETGRHNFGKLLIHLITSMALSLSVFKVVSFGTLEKPMVRLLKQVMLEILQDHPQSTTEAVFSRIAPLTKLHTLHEGLKLFLRHFILGKKKDRTSNQDLVDRVELVDRLLSGKKGHSLL